MKSVERNVKEIKYNFKVGKYVLNKTHTHILKHIKIKEKVNKSGHLKIRNFYQSIL